LDLEQLTDLFLSWGESSFRAKQVRQWMFTGLVGEFSQMTNLPKQFREKLAERTVLNLVTVEKVQEAALDKTKKYLFKLEDEEFVEGVVMDYRYGNTACLSTQVGCRMGCGFCASTLGGLVRNLTAGEILDQLIAMSRDLKGDGQKINRVVLMGTGEPLDNWTEVRKFLDFVHQPDCFNLGFRKITISTCGLVPEILMLSEEKIPVNLAVSLHAPNNEIRNKLVPINRKYPIEQLIAACRHYTDVTKRRITFEYTLIDGVNDTKDCALELAGRLSGLLCHVNLIPLNPVQEKDFARPTVEKLERFKKILSDKGIEVTTRRELGLDLDAACGQLRKKQKE
jgi:23S rRNA (adenine2503-C2)-methyltransferase